MLGAARKGLEWEVIAIPDLRAQVVKLADHLADDLADPLAKPRQPQRPTSSPPMRSTKPDTTTTKNARTKPRPQRTAVRAPK